MKFLLWYKLAHKAFFLYGIIFAVLFIVFHSMRFFLGSALWLAVYYLQV